MRRPDFLRRAAAPGCGRRDGTGPPPPASRALRIACARRPAATLDPGDLWRATGPAKAGRPKGLPRSGSGALPPPRGQPLAGLTPRHHERRDTGTRQPPPDTNVHLFDYVSRQKNYKADRRSAAKLSLNQSRGAPPTATATARLLLPAKPA